MVKIINKTIMHSEELLVHFKELLLKANITWQSFKYERQNKWELNKMEL